MGRSPALEQSSEGSNRGSTTSRLGRRREGLALPLVAHRFGTRGENLWGGNGDRTGCETRKVSVKGGYFAGQVRFASWSPKEEHPRKSGAKSRK